MCVCVICVIAPPRAFDHHRRHHRRRFTAVSMLAFSRARQKTSTMRRVTMYSAARGKKLVLRAVRTLRTDRHKPEHELIGFMGARS